jgi:trigger factor
MNITHETTDALNGVIKMEIYQDDYQEQYQKELREHRRKAVMPGFRPGKVPVSIIEKKYGTALLVEEVNKVVSASLEKYIRDNNLNLLGYPLARPDDTNIDFIRDRNFVFSFDIGFAPEVNVDLESIEPIEKFDVKVDDAALQPFIDRALDDQSKLVEKQSVENGDILSIQIDELDKDGNLDPEGISKKTSIEMSKIADESFRQKLIGSSVGQSFTFDPLKITADAAAAAKLLGIDEEAAQSISSSFTMEITKIERIEEAKYDQDFFSAIFPNDQINTGEEFKERMRQEVKRFYDNDTKHLFSRRAFDRLIEMNDLQLPDEFLKKWLFVNNDEQLSKEQIEKDYEKYRRAMKLQLLQDALLKKYPEIAVSDHDVRNEIMNQFRGYFSGNRNMDDQSNEFDQQLMSIADNYLEKNKQEGDRIHDQIYNMRITELMNKHVQQKVEEITPDELKEKVSELSESDHEHDDDHDHEHQHQHEHDHDEKHDHEHHDDDK